MCSLNCLAKELQRCDDIPRHAWCCKTFSNSAWNRHGWCGRGECISSFQCWWWSRSHWQLDTVIQSWQNMIIFMYRCQALSSHVKPFVFAWCIVKLIWYYISMNMFEFVCVYIYIHYSSVWMHTAMTLIGFLLPHMGRAFGRNCWGNKIGQHCDGGYSDLCRVQAEWLVPKPAAFSLEDPNDTRLVILHAFKSSRTTHVV